MTTQITSLAPERIDVVLDCSGLLCPLPVYRASLALNQLSPGEVLEVIATDPGALEDIPALARQTGSVLLGVERGQDRHRFWIEKGSRS
ncbi:MAG TPA: sulfurtransferase TusA family protein [Acidimicrobiia bacterium]|nr:sulfurtransferase TusA family protein [Acidimicrobiia bacterium]